MGGSLHLPAGMQAHRHVCTRHAGTQAQSHIHTHTWHTRSKPVVRLDALSKRNAFGISHRPFGCNFEALCCEVISHDEILC